MIRKIQSTMDCLRGHRQEQNTKDNSFAKVLDEEIKKLQKGAATDQSKTAPRVRQ